MCISTSQLASQQRVRVPGFAGGARAGLWRNSSFSGLLSTLSIPKRQHLCLDASTPPTNLCDSAKCWFFSCSDYDILKIVQMLRSEAKILFVFHIHVFSTVLHYLFIYLLIYLLNKR